MKLTSIHIQGLGLYPDNVLEIRSGLNIVIGASGSGKSMLYRLLRFALGCESLDSHWLRPESNEGSVSLHFETEEAQHVVTRSIQADGKTRAQMDGKAISLHSLKHITHSKVLLSQQHAHIQLSHPSYWLQMLDRRVEPALSSAYQEAFKHYTDLKQDALKESERALDPEALETLERALALLEPLFKRGDDFETLDHRLRELEEERARLEAFKDWSSCLESIRPDRYAQKLSRYLEASERDALEKFLDLIAEWRDRYDPDAFDTLMHTYEDIDHRLTLFYDAARTCGLPPETLQAHYHTLKQQWEEHHASAVLRHAQEQATRDAEQALIHAGARLTQARIQAAEELSCEMNTLLPQLGLDQTRVSIVLHAIPPQKEGCDRCEVLMQSHKQALPRPLKDIASGGELARLALLLHSLNPEDACYLFDEIDVGISGAVAMRLGSYLRTLSRGRRVVVISHTPQVAAFAQHLWLIEKDMTHSHQSFIHCLPAEEHADGLQLILGGHGSMDSAHAHACQLIEQAQSCMDQTEAT